jgi:CBS domain-containing protein
MTRSQTLSDNVTLLAEPPGNPEAAAIRSAVAAIPLRAASWQTRPTFFVNTNSRTLGDIVKRRKPVTLPETASVQSACRLMRDRRIGSILVIGPEGRLAGLFTGRDAVCRVLAERLDPATTTLGAVMTLEPDSLPSDRRAIDALRMMNQGGYRHLPVVDSWRVVGIVSRGDLIAR